MQSNATSVKSDHKLVGDWKSVLYLSNVASVCWNLLLQVQKVELWGEKGKIKVFEIFFHENSHE